VVGILPFLPLPEPVKGYTQPAVVYSFVVGFAVYWLLAKAGLEPAGVPMEEGRASN
jgi:cytosine permease